MALPRQIQIATVSLVALIALGALAYLNQPEAEAAVQSTDNAYVRADFTVVAPQVSGRVAQVLVQDNQVVQAGTLLATLDDRDFVVALDSARAQVQSSEAAIDSLQAQQARQQSVIREARASVVADDAALRLARADTARYRNLAADGAGTVQALQQAEARLAIQQAGRDRNAATHEAARQQLEILRADLQKARAVLAQARAAQAAAELNLSYTRVVAPQAGMVGERSVRVGAFVGAGKPLMVVVPLDAVYVEANYRETQLAHVRPGQPVRIKVDALPGVVLRGRVDSVAPASSLSYAPIAPQNATGNFTKIVQRLPTRIRLDPAQPEAARLRVGMSVEPEIETGAGGA
ncbi:efflux transporter periplasmic adaptor subunit [Cupriavidus sp. USMAA2-4]|uniref:HlyD family secretion protein n=1 Tax=Cupriavidus sp. USMAA2-4 TaxID=876364 RepID=UPI0008A6B7FC|nr:HlyD family secretion protein [Cupriavidus sp. USMAA2-4]AOY92600.1 efflux transporter periplasmic adaptor subunit [Cupriavidus sp. USMAA2-4]